MKLLDNVLGYFGYYKQANVETLIELLQKQSKELTGLVGAISLMEERDNEQNKIIAALVLMGGDETVLIKKNFLDNVHEGEYFASFDVTDSNDLEISVLIMPQDEDENADSFE